MSVIEDLGDFGVYSYARPSGHTKTAARHHGETASVIEWALVLKGRDGSWLIGHSIPGFKTRWDAVLAAKEPSRQ